MAPCWLPLTSNGRSIQVWQVGTGSVSTGSDALGHGRLRLIRNLVPNLTSEGGQR
ncbi:MAG: hypothetical protein EDM05_000340 (plasmid) [Leptolyngbya sp. IPPAS B-1204]